MALSDEHKAALEQGRSEARKIKAYLKHLETSAPQRGRPLDPAKVEAELAELEERIATATTVKRVSLIQRRMDLTRRLELLATLDDNSGDLEEGFVEAVGGYSARKGISYAAWREAGVPAAVLKRGGITRN